jgi:hypothetical protein
MRRIFFASGVVLLSALAFAFPTPLLAAQTGPSNGPTCVYRLEHLPGSLRDATIASAICFDSLDQAMRFATEPATAAGAAPLSSVVLGIDWDYANRGGENRVWTAARTCSSTESWALSYVGNDWNDRTASAQGYGDCHHYHHYENISYGGSQIDCHTYCATMGVMTDATSSESWDY